MTNLKIGVYAICKNEEKFVKRFCESAKDADEILILDTGSTDGTIELAKKYGAKVYEARVSPWRFDIPRNTALSLVSKDIDICISLDLDEVLEPGWREEIISKWTPTTTRLRYLYDWGNNLRFYYEKIHARVGYRWHHPVHEYPRPDERIKEEYSTTSKLLVTHHPDNTKSRGQYLDLLKLSVKEDPTCPRNAFYYARELTFYSMWEEAIVALKKYLGMESATWDHERSFAMRLLGRGYEHKKEYYTSLQWFIRAAAELPFSRDPWLELAQYYYNRQDWNSCYTNALKCLSITNRELSYTSNSESWGSKPYDLAAISSYYIGKIDESKRYGEQALALDPNDSRLKNNLKFYTK
jgi:glycosyltransferase involved in cell wall biosynthesis